VPRSLRHWSLIIHPIPQNRSAKKHTQFLPSTTSEFHSPTGCPQTLNTILPLSWHKRLHGNCAIEQGDQNIYVHLMITTQKVTIKVQSVPRQSPDIYWLTLTPSVLPNSNYVIMVSDWNRLKYFCVFLYCNHQVRRDFLTTLYVLQTPKLLSNGLTDRLRSTD
jgi:hypothetical protein